MLKNKKMKMKKIEENDSHVRKAASIAGIELLQIKKSSSTIVWIGELTDSGIEPEHSFKI